MRFGVGLRPELWAGIVANAATFDVVEVMVDDLIHLSPRRAAKELQPLRDAGLSLVVHGVGLSLASIDGPDAGYLDKVSRILDALGVEVYSEHCSFHRLGPWSVGQFMPVPFTARWAERVAANVRRVQESTRRRLLVENIAYVTESPRQGLGEPSFLRTVCELSNCGLLLDLENLDVNAANLDYDALEFLAELPLHRVGQIHLAGGHVSDDGVRVDSHRAAVTSDTLALLSAVGPKLSSNCVVIIERDKAFPDSWAPLGQDLTAARGAIAAGNSSVLEGKRFEAHEEPDADRYDARELQEGWLRYFQMGASHSPSPYIEAVPERFRRSFGSILRTKRRDKLRPLLPGTWRHLAAQGQLDEALRGWFRTVPAQSLSRADEVAGFAAFIEGLDTVPEVVRALVAHEAMLVALKSLPYRAWRHRWLPHRRDILSRYSGRALDLASRGAELPPALPRTVRTRYTRRARGVWVQDL